MNRYHGNGPQPPFFPKRRKSVVPDADEGSPTSPQITSTKTKGGLGLPPPPCQAVSPARTLKGLAGQVFVLEHNLAQPWPPRYISTTICFCSLCVMIDYNGVREEGGREEEEEEEEEEEGSSNRGRTQQRCKR